MRRTTWIVFVLGLVALLAMPSTGLAAIKIKRINFDPAGSDTGNNSHLNKEYVVISNTGNSGRQLRRWRLFDQGRIHTFRFPRFKLRANRSVKIHTGRGRDNRFNLYWGLGNYVWNNDGDKATLKTKGGRTASRCSYSSTASSPRRC
jgi:Lamin Tail Domain